MHGTNVKNLDSISILFPPVGFKTSYYKTHRNFSA